MNWLVFLGGHARVERALEKVNELIGKARAGVRRIALMVTDRNYLAGETRPLEQTMLPLRNKGLEMVTLVVGGSQDDARRLAGLTTRPTDIFTASSYGDLPNLAPPIAKYIAHGKRAWLGCYKHGLETFLYHCLQLHAAFSYPCSANYYTVLACSYKMLVPKRSQIIMLTNFVGSSTDSNDLRSLIRKPNSRPNKYNFIKNL